MISEPNSSKSRGYKKALRNFVDVVLVIHVIRLELQEGAIKDRRIELKSQLKPLYRKLYETKPVFRKLFDQKKITEYVYLQFIADFMDHVSMWERNLTRLRRTMKSLYNELTELGELADKKAKALLKN